MKPQLTLLFILFFLIYAFRRHYWSVYYGLIGGSLALGMLSFWWLPNWLTQWSAMVTDYVGYIPIQPLYQVYAGALFPSQWHTWTGLGIILIAVAVVTWMAIHWFRDPSYDMFLLTSLAILGQIISPNPRSMISDQILFLLPLLIWIVNRATRIRWEKPIWWSIFVISTWVAFILYFNGQEPLQAEATWPLISGMWLAWIYFMPPALTSKTGGSKCTQE